MSAISFILDHWVEIVASVSGILAGLYALFLLIPGDQPDKTIKAILDFTQRVSAKPKD